MTDREILCASRDHTLKREKWAGVWAYFIGRKQISKRPVMRLINAGFLVARQDYEYVRSTHLDLTQKGANALEQAGESTVPR